MKLKRIALIILIMLLGLVIICALVIYRPFSPPPEPPEPNQVLWIDAWLENPVCQPPCLDNIIPGVTPADEVAEKLSAHPGVARVDRKKQNYYYEVIQWYSPEDETGREFGEVTVYKDTQIVTGIEVYSHSSVATILLGDFINAFGEPDYVYPYEHLVGALFRSSYCEAELYYIDKGMWVHIFSNEKVFGEKIEITPKAVISMVALLPPPSNIEETFNSKSWYYYAYGNDINKVVTWEGYKKYRCDP